MADALLVAVGFAVVTGVVAARLVAHVRIPDVPILLAAGLVLGPGLGLIETSLIRSALPIAGTLAVIVVLFEGGLAIRREDLAGDASRGVVLALVVFAVTSALAGLVAWLAGFPPGPAALLGMCLGGAGVMIVIPLARQTGAGEAARTLVTVEAVVSDVCVVLGVVALSAWLAGGDAAPATLAKSVATSVLLGAGGGLLAGLAWVAALRLTRPAAHIYLLTIGVLLLAYAAIEFIGGSGLLAVLAFAIVLGNSRLNDFPDPWRGAKPLRPILDSQALAHQHETVFLLRAFFFVGLGASLDPAILTTPRILLLGAALTVAVLAGRWLGVLAVVPARSLPPSDRRAVALMFPLGLAAAALSLVPARMGVPGAEDLAAYAAAAVLGTNLLASFLVAIEMRSRAPSAPATTRASLAGQR